MIDHEILQDIITDHELCAVQKNELQVVVDMLKGNRLIELPCKVGTKLYWINDRFDPTREPMWNHIEEVEVCDFTYNGHSLQVWFADNGLKEYLPLPSTAIEKELFYSREEAEAKLAEKGRIHEV